MCGGRIAEERVQRRLAAILVADPVGAGRMAEAKDAFARLMRSYPDLTVTKVGQALVFSDAMLDRMTDNLRKLGLPE